jgi:hypothetical protein
MPTESGRRLTDILDDVGFSGTPSATGRSSVYVPMMDMFLYVAEPCAYAEQRVDPYLTIFWHPTEERVVGFKLKGLKYIFNVIRDKIPTLKDGDFVRLYTLLENVFILPLDDEPTMDSGDRKQQYEKAMTVAAIEKVRARELDMVGAI